MGRAGVAVRSDWTASAAAFTVSFQLSGPRIGVSRVLPVPRHGGACRPARWNDYPSGAIGGQWPECLLLATAGSPVGEWCGWISEVTTWAARRIRSIRRSERE